MNDPSLAISVNTVSELIALGLVGAMTEETYTELMGLLGSARITGLSTSPDGSKNSSLSAEMLGQDLERLFIRNEGWLIPQSSTRRSHSGCWCNCSKKPDTSKE